MRSADGIVQRLLLSGYSPRRLQQHLLFRSIDRMRGRPYAATFDWFADVEFSVNAEVNVQLMSGGSPTGPVGMGDFQLRDWLREEWRRHGPR